MATETAVAEPSVIPGEHRKRFYWIDWLRFFAAVGVLVAHSRGLNWMDWGSLEASSRNRVVFLAFVFSRLGREFVVVFFVISGFLVGGGTIQRVLRGTFELKPFALDRVARIYVPLIPALLLGGAIAWICGAPQSPWIFVGNLVGLQGVCLPVFAGIAPLWTLAYEIWFYVLAGAVAAMLSANTSTIKPLAFLVVAVACLIFVKLEAVYLLCWLLGAFAYSLVGVRWKPRGVWPCTAILLTVAGAACCELASDSNSLSKSGWLVWLPGLPAATLLLSVGFALLLTQVSFTQPRFGWLAKVEQQGSRFASFSYTLYLTHYSVLLLWDHYGPVRSAVIDGPSLLRFAAKLGSAILVALVMYFLFERQTVQIRDRMRKWFS